MLTVVGPGYSKKCDEGLWFANLFGYKIFELVWKEGAPKKGSSEPEVILYIQTKPERHNHNKFSSNKFGLTYYLRTELDNEHLTNL